MRYTGFSRVGASLMVALCALLGLSGCGGIANDPTLAGRVNSHPITLTGYQSILRLNVASAAASGSPLDYQSPGGRTSLRSTQQSAFDFMVTLELMREQADANHLSVSADEQKKADALIASDVAGVDQTIAKDPTNQGQRDLRAALTPDVIKLLAQRVALQTTLTGAPIFPSWSVRGILLSDIATAHDVLQKAQGGADFAALAKQYSQDTQTAQNGGDLGARIFPGQISSEFSANAFGAHPVKVFETTIGSGQYAVFQLSDPQKTSLAQQGDSQAQQQILFDWLNTVVRQSANVEHYVTL